MKKQDILSSIFIGFIFGIALNAIAYNVGQRIPYLFLAPVLFPFLAVFGLFAAFFMGKRFPVLFQFAKFGLVGVSNTTVDLGILNLLIFFTGISGGFLFPIFKGTSFIFSVINSYFWNKFWTFQSKEKVQTTEVTKFFTIAISGFVVNVSIASLIVNAIGPQFGISFKAWANIAAIIAIFAVMFWDFAGYKLFVFKSIRSSKSKIINLKS